MKNELLCVVKTIYKEVIKKKLSESDFVSIIADETTSTFKSKSALLVIVFRYGHAFTLKKRFINLVNAC